MTPRKVTRAALNSKTGEEQSAPPQHEEDGSLPPQESPENVAADIPDVPLAGPLETLSQPELSVDGPMIRVEFYAHAEMMRALKRQLSPQLQSQQQQPAVHTHLDTPSLIPPVTLIPTLSPTIGPLVPVGSSAPSTEYIQIWGPLHYVCIEETSALQPAIDSTRGAPST
ncbi:hypothetical protein ACLOJK_034250, partial [Asimina triloba]